MKRSEEALNCCDDGRMRVPRLQPVPADVQHLSDQASFCARQRAYNNILALNALDSYRTTRTWTQPQGLSMLHIHAQTNYRTHCYLQ